MAIPTQLGIGGAGLHGDNAGAVARSLTALATLANELKSDHNALLTKLDADGTVADTNYAATLAVAAADASGTNTLSAGGTGLQGDAAVKLARRVRLIGALAAEIKADHNALLVKLDADGGVSADTLGPRTEVQTVTVDATGGGWRAVRGGVTSDLIPFNATASAVQSVLEAMDSVATGEIVVTGGIGAAGGGTPYTLTHSGARSAATDVAQITTVATGLTGGAGTAVVATTVTGRAGANTVTAVPAIGLWPTAWGAGGQGIVGEKGWGVSLKQAAAILNEAKTRHNALLAILDGDSGVADTNYAATLAVAAPSV